MRVPKSVYQTPNSAIWVITSAYSKIPLFSPIFSPWIFYQPRILIITHYHNSMIVTSTPGAVMNPILIGVPSSICTNSSDYWVFLKQGNYLIVIKIDVSLIRSCSHSHILLITNSSMSSERIIRVEIVIRNSFFSGMSQYPIHSTSILAIRIWTTL